MKLRFVSHFRPMPRVTIALVYALVLGQGALLSPLVASELNGRLETLRAWGDQAATAVQRRIPERPVRVNRTVPKVTPPNLTVAFGANPSAEALMAARVFSHPLSPVGGVPSREDNVALARAMEMYVQAGERPLRAQILEDYLGASARSPWRAGVALNLGTILWRQGFFSRAARYYREAWDAAKNETTMTGRAIGDSAIAELVTHQMTFGQLDALDASLAEVEGRPVRGGAGSKVDAARMGAATLRNHHEAAVFSGPAALQALIDKVGSPRPDSRQTIKAYLPTHAGTSLSELLRLGDSAGLRLSMRHVDRPADLPVPSVVHLKSLHYSTVFDRKDGTYVLRDAALGGLMTLSEAALADEMTGFVLVPASNGSLGRDVTPEEASGVVGHCWPGVPDWEDCNCGGGGSGNGMPVAGLNSLTASVNLDDTPLSYSPPVGPSVSFHLRYNQRTIRLAQVPTYSNVGPLWSHDWLSWVEDNNTSAAAPYSWENVTVRGFGTEQYNSYDGPTYWRTRATLTKVTQDPPRYERALPDGTVEVYTFPDRAASLPQRRVFLTQVIDPQGHALTYTYDAQVRLVSLTDAIGQVTTLAYEDAANPLRITRVTDPFGRAAILTYDGLGRIETLTDTVGMTSRMTYEADDFVQALTTPYGTTSFRRGPDGTFSGSFRRIELTDPEGGTERVEYHLFGAVLGLAATVPAGEVPAGFSDMNQGLDYFNTLHWDKRAMAEAPGDVARATVTHWLVRANMSYLTAGATFARRIPHSIKRPLETRIWYRYPDQPSYQAAGTGTKPSEVARLLENGTTQKTLTSYNAKGMVTNKTDPLGRQTTYTYAANGIDVLEVRQVNGGATDLLATYAGYNAQHLPTTVTDAAGQTTTTTYNAAGQPLTVTNPKSEVTTYSYQSGTGYLQTATGAVAGSTTTYGYDGYGRVNAVTEPDGYAVTMQYDALNRLTRRTYPDGTYDETTYQRLDAATERDRKGRVIRHFYDGLGRRTSTRDALGRVITQVWCACGALDALIDANGNRTSWERDWQNRVTREVRADGVTDTLYTYDATGRPKTITDPKNQVTTHTYATDDSLLTTVYTNATISTPSVTYTYDPVYPRVLTMVDGIGTTTYAYKAPGVLGAGRVASVDGPLTNDTITYIYDELGRVTVRAINGTANTVTWEFDALGRVESEANVLGTFTYTYDGVTSRLATVTYPNNQTSAYSYSPNNQDHRLQTIHHKYPNGTTLSKFDYTYDAVGNILTWRQQSDSTAVNWRYGYDAADQLTSAIKESTDPTPVIQKRYGYGYDPAGNRLFEQIDDQVIAASHDNLNRLTQHTPGGPLQLVGTVSEPSNVTIAGQPAIVDPSNTFRGQVATNVGTTSVTITATDPSGNVASRQYEVDVTGATTTFTYDANGNMTGDGTRAFEWDARNQLTAIAVGSQRVEFSYDGLGRRVRTVSIAVQTTQLDSIWCGSILCEDVASGGSRTRFFRLARQSDGVAEYLVLDHLGSNEAAVNASGAVESRRSYDPWGRVTVTAGAVGDNGFTGHRWAGLGGLWLTLHRSYDPSIGRWLSEDPVRLDAGPNFFAYVNGRPTVLWDPFGLASCCDELKKRIKRVEEIIDSLLKNKEIVSTGPYATSSCDESGGTYNILPHVPPCIRDCIKAHEEVHVRQCKQYGPLGIADLPYGGELEAYRVELKCLKSKSSSEPCC